MNLYINDPWVSTRMLLVIIHKLAAPLLHRLSNPVFRSTTAGAILGLLMIVSVVEQLTVMIFGIIRLTLITILVSLGGAELLYWVMRDMLKPGDKDSTDREINSTAREDK
jgi:hypothetical protein